MLFNKCQVFQNEMNCYLCVVLLALLGRKVISHPVTTSSTLKPNTTIEIIEEIGKNLNQIPQGYTTVKTLSLSYNHISNLPEYVFHNNSYRALNKIELYQNKITTISLNAFRGLRQLIQIDLSDNNITALDPYTFKFNPRILKLDLSGNQITFTRLQVFLMSQSLETLILSRNQIEQIYQLTFVSLPNLRNLVLDNNVLFIIAPNSFRITNKLQYLSVANTGVYRLSESMFEELPRIIDLQETPLAKRFDPPLNKVINNAVRSLLLIDQYIYLDDKPV